MADLEAVLADVSYLMAMEKSKESDKKIFYEPDLFLMTHNLWILSYILWPDYAILKGTGKTVPFEYRIYLKSHV